MCYFDSACRPETVQRELTDQAAAASQSWQSSSSSSSSSSDSSRIIRDKRKLVGITRIKPAQLATSCLNLLQWSVIVDLISTTCYGLDDVTRTCLVVLSGDRRCGSSGTRRRRRELGPTESTHRQHANVTAANPLNITTAFWRRKRLWSLVTAGKHTYTNLYKVWRLLIERFRNKMLLVDFV